jgi:hypothetical protein
MAYTTTNVGSLKSHVLEYKCVMVGKMHRVT